MFLSCSFVSRCLAPGDTRLDPKWRNDEGLTNGISADELVLMMDCMILRLGLDAGLALHSVIYFLYSVVRQCALPSSF